MFPAIILLLLLRVIQVRNEFYKDSQGVLLVYDVGLRESFDALDSWLGEMKQEMGSQANMDSIVFIVCANKVRLTHFQRGATSCSLPLWCRFLHQTPLRN